MLDLFGFSNDPTVNLLPCDGEVHYYGKLMTPKQANDYYTELMSNIAWENDQAIIFGKRIITKRKVAWYGDQPFQYTYSKITKEALTWTPALKQLKDMAEKESGESYNSCLLNLYHTGEEGMAWHSDGEKDLKKMAPLHHSVLAQKENLHSNIKNQQNWSMYSLNMEAFWS